MPFLPRAGEGERNGVWISQTSRRLSSWRTGWPVLEEGLSLNNGCSWRGHCLIGSSRIKAWILILWCGSICCSSLYIRDTVVYSINTFVAVYRITVSQAQLLCPAHCRSLCALLVFFKVYFLFTTNQCLKKTLHVAICSLRIFFDLLDIKLIFLCDNIYIYWIKNNNFFFSYLNNNKKNAFLEI